MVNIILLIVFARGEVKRGMSYKQKSDLSEKIYIIRRKGKALLHSLPYYICRVLPINQRKVVMWTFECNGGYGCSPRYIAEEILKRNREGKTNYQVVWLLNNIEKEFPKEIKKVKNTLWSRAYHLSTAGIWVGNTRTSYGTRKRKKQCYIQTWHSTIAIKPIGKYRGSMFPKMAYLVSKYDSSLIDYVLSGSTWCEHMYRDGLLYQGEMIRTGTPRCDVLFNQRKEKRQEIRKKYHLPKEANILLYAPTFRGGSQKGQRSVSAEEITIDFEQLLMVLEKKFGGEWYIFLRLHPQLAVKKKKAEIQKKSKRLVDVSQMEDMNEIIAGVDIFVTDYSSAIFEGAMAGLPGFIYADDLKEYIHDRGKLFFDIDKLPFPAAFDNEGLIKNILVFDKELYERKWKNFMEETGIFEDGHASERVVDLIINGK